MSAKGVKFIKVVTGGTHREMGVDFGRAVAPILREIIVESASLYRRYFGKTTDHVRAYAMSHLLRPSRQAYPNYIEELEGIAEGASVPFGDLFFISADEELAALWDDREHCSSAAIRTPKGILLGHNEDYPPRYLDRLVIVDAKPHGAPSFLAVTYPYMLAGPSCGVNGAGMAFAANSLNFPIAKRGIPTNFILRDLFRTRSLSGAARVMKKTGALMGNAVVAVSAVDDDARVIEARPDGTTALLRMGANGILAHTNHVCSKSLSTVDETPRFNSRVRLAALQHLLRPGQLTPKRLRDTLSSEEYGLRRQVEGPHDSCTVASVILDPSRSRIEIAKHGRKGHGFITYTMRKK